MLASLPDAPVYRYAASPSWGQLFKTEFCSCVFTRLNVENCHLRCLWRVRKSRSLRKGDTSWGSLGWMWSSLMPGTGSEPSLGLWQPWQRSASRAQSQTPPSSAWQKEREAANRLPSFNRGAQGSGAGTSRTSGSSPPTSCPRIWQAVRCPH